MMVFVMTGIESWIPFWEPEWMVLVLLLDLDLLDGVIDLYVISVTVPGSVENDGCSNRRTQEKKEDVVVDALNKNFE